MSFQSMKGIDSNFFGILYIYIIYIIIIYIITDYNYLNNDDSKKLPGLKLLQADCFYWINWSGGANFAVVISVPGTNFTRTKIPVTAPDPSSSCKGCG